MSFDVHVALYDAEYDGVKVIGVFMDQAKAVAACEEEDGQYPGPDSPAPMPLEWETLTSDGRKTALRLAEDVGGQGLFARVDEGGYLVVTKRVG